MLAGSVHEQAVLLSALAADVEAFQRSWSQLAPFYVQGSSLAEGLPPAPLQARLTALNLLRLLSSAEVAQFHVELELLPMEASSWGAFPMYFPVAGCITPLGREGMVPGGMAAGHCRREARA